MKSLRWNNFLRFFFHFLFVCASVHCSTATLHYVLLNISRRLSRPATNRWWRKCSALLICFMVTYEKYLDGLAGKTCALCAQMSKHSANGVSLYFSPARCESNIRVYLLKCLLWHCIVLPVSALHSFFNFFAVAAVDYSRAQFAILQLHIYKNFEKIAFFLLLANERKRKQKNHLAKYSFAAIFSFAEVLVLQRSFRILLLSTNNESSKRQKKCTHVAPIVCVLRNFAKVVMAKFTIRSLCNLQRRMLCFCCHLKWNAVHTILNVAQQNGLWNIEHGERTFARSSEWITCSNRSAKMCRRFMRTKDGIEIADETHFCFEFCQRFFFASFSF